MKGISQYSSESIRTLETVVIKRFGVSRAELLSRMRIGAHARQVMFYLLNKHFLYSSVQIGRMYNRDHSTVLNGIKTVRKSKVVSEQADSLFLKCLQGVDSEGISLGNRVDKSGDNVVDKLPHDQGMPSYPTISTRKSNKTVDKKSRKNQR